MIHKILLAIFSILVLPSFSQAQGVEKSIFVEEVNDVVTSVHTIHKDKNGFLWVGRWDGLYRFDGINFKSFNHIAKTWTNFAVRSIQEDNVGNLWVGATLHDLLIYNPEKDTTQNIQEIYPEVIIPGLWSDIVLHDSITFVASSEKIFVINNNLQRLNKAISVYDDYNQYIKAIKTDVKGNLWVALQYGLLKISPDLKQDYYSQLFTDELSGILVDLDGSIWIRTISKLIHFDPLTEIQKEFLFLQNNETWLSDGNSAIEQDGNGFIWLGSSTKGGLVRFNPETENFDFFPHKPDDPNSVSSNYIRKLVYSKDDDILWIGTEIGLNKIVFNKQNFNVTSLHLPNQQNYIIESLYQDPDSNLWGRTNDQKIHLLINNPNISIIDKPWLKKVVSMNPEFYLEEDQNGNLLFIGHNKGLYRLDKKNGVMKSINSDLIPNTANPIKLFGNDKILARDGGNAIIIAMGDTLRIIKEILFNKNANVRMMTDQYNNILASRGDGAIYMLDLIKQEFISIYKAKVGDPLDHTVFIKDKEDVIWIGTAGSGLLSFDPRSGKLKNYGFSDHTIGEILMDDNNNIWASTNKGLLMVNAKTEIVTQYTSSDGFPSDQIRNNVFLKGKDGNFYVGVFDKVVSFDPIKIKAHDFIPPIFITNIKIVNKSISEINDQYKVVELIPEIVMNYDQNTLSFEFASLNYAYPDKTIYNYQMTNVDNNWIQSETQQVTYSNLAPGTYFFRVKASNSHHVTDSEIKEIKITILPPFWKTWWAYSLYATFLGTLVYIFWKRWITRVELKTLAFKKSAEAEKLREMDILKSNFFANISHEFRTPLTLLLGPLEKRLALASDSNDKKELGMMQRNAARLLTLVNQLLDLSRLEAGTLKLKCIHGDLHSAILSISSQFSSIADSREIDFEIVSKQSVMLFYDPDKLEKIITNLLSNSFKFTPARGRISITITQQPPTENFIYGYAEIAFDDTGKGIESEHLSKIFDRFYQADMSSTRAYEGSGIGLSLTKELVELHHGSISVTSTVGKGSTFTVKLPMGDTHLKPEEIQSDNVDLITIKSNGAVHIDTRENIIENGANELPHLLLVEDNADLRYYLRENLKQQFNLLEAEDGERGIAMALNEIPDLIISDLMMPKVNGLQLCQLLKDDEKTSHIPIILLTAKADIETRLQGFKYGADDYIAKPFQIEEVIVRIENLIANRKRIQEKFERTLTLTPSAVPVTSIDERFVKRAMEVVEKIIGDSSLGVEFFAEEMGVSSTQLYRKLRAITGYSPNEFIRHMRLLRAADLMRKKAGNVAEIAYQVGFNNLSYFSKVFKEKFGITPIEFLKNPIPNTGR